VFVAMQSDGPQARRLPKILLLALGEVTYLDNFRSFWRHGFGEMPDIPDI
jgi:hypothetical protein